MSESFETDLALEASRAWPLEQLCTLLEWVGEGRALTQTRKVRLADARELVGLLGTGDLPDGWGAERNMISSTELPELTIIVEWAKAARLVRVSKGRLVPVKKNAALLRRPLELWARMLESFPRLGEALCPPGWAESLLREDFEEALDAVFTELRRRADGLDIETACELAWETITARYLFAPAGEQSQSLWRALCDRDLRHALGVLERFGALRRDGDRVALTELGSAAMRASTGAISQDAVLQVKVSLLEVAEPPVWRRLQVFADIRLDEMHQVIQAAMGWEDDHLHAFSDGSFRYSSPDWDLECRDERGMTLGGLLAGAGGRAGYVYDFGDDWEHELILERTLPAEPGMRYPVCVAGAGACPPEDCGGVWGYMDLRDALVDPDHERHQELLDWLGLQTASGLDPARFDVDEANRALTGRVRVAGLSGFDSEDAQAQQAA
ncbi:MAG: plasmid pRiA4b ORF-3 family protein [Solirubrobacteraceae bacterium]